MLKDYDIKASRIEGMTGVWVEDAKICAMGLAASRFVTYHGIGLNIDTQLNDFNNIIPCGLSNPNVTSMNQILKKRLVGLR